MSCNDFFILNIDNNKYEFNINILNHKEDDIKDLIIECNEVLYYFNKILYKCKKKIYESNKIFDSYVILFESKNNINNKIIICYFYKTSIFLIFKRWIS